MKSSTKWLLALLVLVSAAVLGWAPFSGGGREVGDLHDDGLRFDPSGRSDAGAVLDPEQFPDTSVRHAYWIAIQIPETLNHLSCWCGCENRGVRRSNLQRFGDRMAVDRDVCRRTAEIAHRMVQGRGSTDPGRIQLAVDRLWAPEGTELWEPREGT